MINGQAIKKDFYVLTTSEDLENMDLIPKKKECCFALPALAEYYFTSNLKNDKHSVIWFFGELFTSADVDIFIQKKTNGTYVDTLLGDNSYGVYKPFGFFVNKFNESAIGYQIDWALILNTLGEGLYRFKAYGTPSIGDTVQYLSFEFELRKYTDARANGTVRAEWYRKGILGNKNIDSKIDDFGTLNYFNQIRLPKSIFGFETSQFERTNVKYQNGSQVWVKDSQIEELSWNIRLMPEPVHRFLRVDMMQSGRVIITDYNSSNPTPHIETQCIPNSEYAPEWKEGVMTAPVTLKFNKYYQNLDHLRE